MVYEDIFKALYEEEVRYLIVGGMAVNLYGYARMTVDLDIMVDLEEEENLKRLIKAMEKINCKPKVPVKPIEFTLSEKREDWIKEKGAVVFTFIDLSDPIKHIDIFLRNPVDFEKAYQSRTTIPLKGIPISLVSIDDLIELKRLSGRPRDLEDIHHLNKIKELKKNAHGY
ncbi:MAG: nucleotidyl transferase AbiEii/AbiGii toxin family protein [Deltaproteobacteria bacterium]|nr:nucleotidyl transferase AbiEii/AbiGii toxin family protein [Deltaproteobacteria bacterium]